MILYVIKDMLGDEELAQAGLEKLKEAFAIFAENKQQHPLVYERESPLTLGVERSWQKKVLTSAVQVLGAESSPQQHTPPAAMAPTLATPTTTTTTSTGATLSFPRR